MAGLPLGLQQKGLIVAGFLFLFVLGESLRFNCWAMNRGEPTAPGYPSQPTPHTQHTHASGRLALELGKIVTNSTNAGTHASLQPLLPVTSSAGWPAGPPAHQRWGQPRRVGG